MRARTPMAFALLLFSLPTAASASSVISAHSGVQPPYLGNTGGIIKLNDPQFFVATGTISDLVVPVVSGLALTGSETLYMQLFDAYHHRRLDCQTPTKTIDAWGISHLAEDLNVPITDFGPFAGSECSISPDDSGDTNGIYARLYHGDDSDAADTAGWEANADGFNFTAYAGGVSAKASSVLFLPGVSASRLYMRGPDTIDLRVWEPSNALDANLLAMTPAGDSINQIYTRDIVDSLYSSPLTSGVQDVYGSFEHFLDGLVIDGTIEEWRAYPYDWRYDPFDIVNGGTLTEMPDGSLRQIYLAEVLREMAADSPTGKVTIIAHSNGGLVAKALVTTLGPSASEYIDRVVLVGVPQFGTPQDLETMLHGDGQTYLGGLLLYSGNVRESARTMPGLYGLLPSSSYFSAPPSPVAFFDPGEVSGLYARAYGDSIEEYASLEHFLSDAGSASALAGTPGDIHIPLILRADLLAKAEATHAALDTWAAPAGITVATLVGTQQPTNEAIDYRTEEGSFACDRDGLFSITKCGFGPRLMHGGIQTEQGDGTVVAASAAGTTGAAWYFDTSAYSSESGIDITHSDLTAAAPVQNFIKQLLLNSAPAATSSLSTQLGVDVLEARTTIAASADAPLSVVVTDAVGHTSGLFPAPGTSGVQYEKHGSHGVALESLTGTQSIALPDPGTYTIVLKPSISGKIKVRVTKTAPDRTSTTTALYEDIPTTASTTITIEDHQGALDAPVVDENGDGSDIFTLATDTPALETTSAARIELNTQINALVVRPGIKNRLLRALTTNDYPLLETLIKAQAGVKISLDQGASLLELLNTLDIGN